MDSVDDILSDIVADVDAVFLFSPNSSFYERFEGDATTVVVAPENTVDAATFVELPIEFTNIRDRIRFGIEGAMDDDVVAKGDTVAWKHAGGEAHSATAYERKIPEASEPRIKYLSPPSVAGTESRSMAIMVYSDSDISSRPR